eukprot:9096464-Pyramimonas_sp.AAC.1
MTTSIHIVLDTLTSVFRSCHLELNWGPGKSECVLRLRGTGAATALEKWRQPDGSLGIPLQQYGHDRLLRIVPWYKHLGSTLDSLGMHAGNVLHHIKSAM